MGGPRHRTIPEGDQHERLVCLDCGYIAYENPKILVGSVVRAGDQVLLCRRAIEPRVGFWTLPAGFLELRETPEAGARREAWEEAQAEIEIEGLLAVYTILPMSQVQLIYRARLAQPKFAPGPESLEVALFPLDRLPLTELAFPSVAWALADEARAAPNRLPFGNPPGGLGRLEELG